MCSKEGRVDIGCRSGCRNHNGRRPAGWHSHHHWRGSRNDHRWGWPVNWRWRSTGHVRRWTTCHSPDVGWSSHVRRRTAKRHTHWRASHSSRRSMHSWRTSMMWLKLLRLLLWLLLGRRRSSGFRLRFELCKCLFTRIGDHRSLTVQLFSPNFFHQHAHGSGGANRYGAVPFRL